MKGRRDRAILAILLGCGLRRAEVAKLQVRDIQHHVSVETTERYLGCKQRLRHAVNDKIGLEP